MNLLIAPLIRTDREAVSLPGLLAAMARGDVAAFPGLRPHQRPAWHMFLVQLAVLALAKAGLEALPETEAGWLDALRRLSAAFPDDDPWHLVGSDRSRPAFLQPPDPGGLKWSDVATADALDMVITSRNHDVKREIAREAEADDWIFALVSLQTMEGFGGAGNYGIARMNGGSSSRVLLGLAPAGPGGTEIDPSAWWRRDVARIRAERARNGQVALQGKALVWLEPWPDEPVSLGFAALDPQFIEICRRVRMVVRDGRLAAERSTSRAARIAARELKGNTGDPWAPVHVGEGKALTLGEGSFDYRQLVRLLFGTDWARPLLVEPDEREAKAPMLLVAEAFARGNSKTDGFSSRLVAMPKAVLRSGLFTEVSSVAADLLVDIESIDKALRDGLAVAANGGEREDIGKAHYARSQPARDALKRAVDRLFFPELWKRAAARKDADFTPLRRAFLATLADLARAEFEAALPAIPCAGIFRPRAEERGRAMLEVRLFNALKDLKQAEVADV